MLGCSSPLFDLESSSGTTTRLEDTELTTAALDDASSPGETDKSDETGSSITSDSESSSTTESDDGVDPCRPSAFDPPPATTLTSFWGPSLVDADDGLDAKLSEAHGTSDGWLLGRMRDDLLLVDPDGNAQRRAHEGAVRLTGSRDGHYGVISSDPARGRLFDRSGAPLFAFDFERVRGPSSTRASFGRVFPASERMLLTILGFNGENEFLAGYEMWELNATDPAGPTLLWTRPSSGGTIDTGKAHVLAHDHERGIEAIDLDGRELWKHDERERLGFRTSSDQPIAITQDWGSESRLTWFDAAGNQREWLPQHPVREYAVSSNGRWAAYVTESTRDLQDRIFVLRNGDEFANFPSRPIARRSFVIDDHGWVVRGLQPDDGRSAVVVADPDGRELARMSWPAESDDRILGIGLFPDHRAFYVHERTRLRACSYGE